MEKTIFDFDKYKAYFESRVGTREQRRGLKSEIAKALRVQPTYISQVLHGKAHLSLEQADLLNHFFGHGPEESEFFLLLVQRDRAGTRSLAGHFDRHLETARKKRMVLTERLGSANELQTKDRTRYYSSWHYAALHIALTIPELQSEKGLAEYFRLPLKKVNFILEFLCSTGLAIKKAEGRYAIGKSLVRLGNQSPDIYRHHSNWRLLAMESLDREEIHDLHYSGVVSLSRKDALKIKDLLLDSLKSNIEIIRESKEEELYSYCIDFFSLRK